MELAVEAVLQQSHFVQVEGVVHRHLLSLDGGRVHTTVHPVGLQRAAQCLHVLTGVQRLDALGIQEADAREEALAHAAQLHLRGRGREGLRRCRWC